MMSAMQAQLCVHYEASFDLRLPKNIGVSYGRAKLTPSALQKSVGSFCEKVGFECVEEHVISEDDKLLPGRTFLSIDLANVAKKQGIEVDGPAHFINVIDDNDDDDDGNNNEISPTGDYVVDRQRAHMRLDQFRDTNGATAMKHRLLCHEGFNVVHVPFFIWAKLMSEEEKMSYIGETVDEFCEGF